MCFGLDEEVIRWTGRPAMRPIAFWNASWKTDESGEEEPPDVSVQEGSIPALINVTLPSMIRAACDLFGSV